jgi:hypothetical protein
MFESSSLKASLLRSIDLESSAGGLTTTVHDAAMRRNNKRIMNFFITKTP